MLLHVLKLASEALSNDCGVRTTGCDHVIVVLWMRLIVVIDFYDVGDNSLYDGKCMASRHGFSQLYYFRVVTDFHTCTKMSPQIFFTRARRHRHRFS